MRLFISLVLSIPMIFAVFIFMAQLIPANANEEITIEKFPLPDFKPPIFDDTLSTKQYDKLPEPQKPLTQPIDSESIEPVDTETPAIIPDPYLNPGDIVTNLKGTNTFTGPSGSTDDGDALPEIVYEPVWPTNADRNGSVRFCFSVDIDGRVSNIKLIRSEPGRLFVRNAKNAIKKWRFRPAMENGSPVYTDNMCYTMVFEYMENQ